MSVFANGCVAAISLTYDDGVHQLLDHAIPDLEAAGYRGTFFNQSGPSCLTWASRQAEWRAAAERGHEIGNHTVNHPCSQKHVWIRPENSLENHTLESIEAELIQASDDIEAKIGIRPASYAYTCGEDFVTAERISYVPIVRRLFTLGRSFGQQEAPAIPGTIDFASVPTFGVAPLMSASDLKGIVDQCIEAKAWGVLVFHGVGGGHTLDVSRQAHQSLIAHIQSRKDQIDCDTFINVGRRLLGQGG